MIEHKYFICKTSWCINIVIRAEIANMDEADAESPAVQAAERIWIKFAEKPLIKEEKFDDSDLPYLVKGLQLVKNQIFSNSIYIKIHWLLLMICNIVFVISKKKD